MPKQSSQCRNKTFARLFVYKSANFGQCEAEFFAMTFLMGGKGKKVAKRHNSYKCQFGVYYFNRFFFFFFCHLVLLAKALLYLHRFRLPFLHHCFFLLRLPYLFKNCINVGIAL